MAKTDDEDFRREFADDNSVSDCTEFSYLVPSQNTSTNKLKISDGHQTSPQPKPTLPPRQNKPDKKVQENSALLKEENLTTNRGEARAKFKKTNNLVNIKKKHGTTPSSTKSTESKQPITLANENDENENENHYDDPEPGKLEPPSATNLALQTMCKNYLCLLPGITFEIKLSTSKVPLDPKKENDTSAEEINDTSQLSIKNRMALLESKLILSAPQSQKADHISSNLQTNVTSTSGALNKSSAELKPSMAPPSVHNGRDVLTAKNYITDSEQIKKVQRDLIANQEPKLKQIKRHDSDSFSPPPPPSSVKPETKIVNKQKNDLNCSNSATSINNNQIKRKDSDSFSPPPPSASAKPKTIIVIKSKDGSDGSNSSTSNNNQNNGANSTTFSSSNNEQSDLPALPGKSPKSLPTPSPTPTKDDNIIPPPRKSKTTNANKLNKNDLDGSNSATSDNKNQNNGANSTTSSSNNEQSDLSALSGKSPTPTKDDSIAPPPRKSKTTNANKLSKEGSNGSNSVTLNKTHSGGSNLTEQHPVKDTNNVTISDDLKSYSWYTTEDREKREESLKSSNKIGVFRVGPASSSIYSLTVCTGAGKVTTLRIRKKENEKFALGTEKSNEHEFSSVVEMIEWHKSNALQIKNESSVCLIDLNKPSLKK